MVELVFGATQLTTYEQEDLFDALRLVREDEGEEALDAGDYLELGGGGALLVEV